MQGYYKRDISPDIDILLSGAGTVVGSTSLGEICMHIFYYQFAVVNRLAESLFGLLTPSDYWHEEELFALLK